MSARKRIQNTYNRLQITVNRKQITEKREQIADYPVVYNTTGLIIYDC